MSTRLLVVFVCLFIVQTVAAQSWLAAQALAFPTADPYVNIPSAVLKPGRHSSYRAIFDGTRRSNDPKVLLPAVNAVGGILNDLAIGGTLNQNRRFAIVFHGDATDGILDNVHYREKYGVDNPNLPVLKRMKKMGVDLMVCGQHLAANKIDPQTLTQDVIIASDAYLVLIAYQNKGYASMWF